jgi:3-hydroxyisobutyrate dehydrogenase-like beta-hydroxyacid dehydrogenase
MSTIVGVIGLGAMGSAIAIRLTQAGFDVIGIDLLDKNMAELEDHGGRRAATPRAIAEEADFILTSLPSAEAFHEVTTGQAGIAAAGRLGIIVIDTSTLAIDDKAEAARRLADGDITLLDCTVSGSRATCLAGDLATFASGDEAAYKRSTDVFAAFANPLHWMGEFGNASRIKYVLNYLVCINNAASAEALVYGTKMGLDPQQVYDLVCTSVARSRIWELRAKMMVDGDYTTSRGTYNISRKDAKIISQIAQEIEAPAPVFNAALQMHYAGMAQGYSGNDTASLYEVYKRAAGIRDIVEPE